MPRKYRYDGPLPTPEQAYADIVEFDRAGKFQADLAEHWGIPLSTVGKVWRIVHQAMNNEREMHNLRESFRLRRKRMEHYKEKTRVRAPAKKRAPIPRDPEKTWIKMLKGQTYHNSQHYGG